jgi:hypothetical protein
MTKVTGLIAGLCLVFTVLSPVPALAAEPVSLSASGCVNAVSEATDFPAGKSGRFVVTERDVYGMFTSGDIQGDFVMTYHANVELATQAGNFKGMLVCGPCKFLVTGKAQPVEFSPVPGGFIGMLKSTGHWTLLEGATGQGTFETRLDFIPTPDGHIAQVLPSSVFTISGRWQPER